MNSIALLPIFLIGLLGGVHCVGMCGGIVSAFSIGTSGRRPFPVAVVTRTSWISLATDGGLRVFAFNIGRIGSYMAAGALAGTLGSLPALINMAALQTAGYWVANLMLVALGLTLINERLAWFVPHRSSGPARMATRAAADALIAAGAKRLAGDSAG